MLTEMLASALVMYSKLTIFIFHVMLQTVLVAGGREGYLEQSEGTFVQEFFVNCTEPTRHVLNKDLQ